MKKASIVVFFIILVLCQYSTALAYTSPGVLFDWTVLGNESGHEIATETKQDAGQKWRVQIKKYTSITGNNTYFNIRNSAGTRMSKARLFEGAQDKTTSYSKTAKKGKDYTLTCEIKNSTLIGPPRENCTFGEGRWSP